MQRKRSSQLIWNRERVEWLIRSNSYGCRSLDDRWGWEPGSNAEGSPEQPQFSYIPQVLYDDFVHVMSETPSVLEFQWVPLLVASKNQVRNANCGNPPCIISYLALIARRSAQWFTVYQFSIHLIEVLNDKPADQHAEVFNSNAGALGDAIEELEAGGCAVFEDFDKYQLKGLRTGSESLMFL